MFFYIIEKFSKRRYLKWSCIIFLRLWIKSYDRKKRLIIKFFKFLFTLFAMKRRGLNCLILRRGMAFKDYSTFVTKKGKGAQSNQTPWQDTDPHGAPISEVPKLNWGPWSSFSLKLYSRLNLYAHLDLQTYTVCILETFTTPIMELRTWILFTEYTDTDCLRSLPICHLSDNSQDLVLSTSDSWHTHVQQDLIPVSWIECNSKTLTTLFLTRSLCTANIEGANVYKNVKCTDSWMPFSQYSSQILALMQTTSIYLWFLVLLCYSLKLCSLVPITTTWLVTGASEKVYNQSKLPPNQLIYSSIYTSP
jgi:hypothetical protein